MEGKQKTFLNAILHETGERVMVTHDQKGSPFFVDINGKKYHIERLDLSEALPPMIPMMGESEQMKSLTDIMKTFDVKEQDDHRAKIAEREYWRKLRGDIFIAMLNRSGYQLQLLDDVAYIINALKVQDQEPFDDNIITRDDEILQAISIGLTDAEKDLGWSDFGGLPIEEIQDWLEKQGQTFTQKDVDDAYLKGVSDTKHELEKQEEKPQGKTALEAWKDMRLEVYQQASGNRHEPNYSDDSTKMFSLNDIDEIIEKISEQKPAYKVELVESKFNEGDWIVYKNDICQIVKREEGCNKLVTVFGIEKELVNERNLSTARLWSIADAKPGDVLEFGDHGRLVTGILSFVNKNTGKVDVSCLLEGGKFKVGVFYNLDTVKPHPATKEQRDTLMKAMADAGYTFDFGKKELKKTEPKSKENKGNIGGFSSNSKWSEEDEKTLNEIFSVAARASLRKSTLFGKSYDYIKWQNWLKSLRPQNHWKPSSEQMKALNAINVTGGISYAGQGQVLIELYNDLKKLKEE